MSAKARRLQFKTFEHASSKMGWAAKDIEALFSPWEAARGILLGVSGGPDSVALMLLAAEWSNGMTTRPPIYVATVDHRLREDSASEAETVARWAAELALPHAILVWDGAKPKSRIQERARDARYALLLEHAERIGADHLMTAHHADDQAETILFRLLRGSGISGLSGIAGSSKRKGLTVARPLLNCNKAELVALCTLKAHAFLLDPSNLNPGFARTRMRRLSGLLVEEGLDQKTLLRLGRRAARADAALDVQTRAAAAQLKVQREPGRFEADISALADVPDEILLRFLADELKLIREDKPLRLERLETLAAGLGRALRDGISYKATLGGAALRLQSNRFLVIIRENNRRRGQNPPVSDDARS
jgi:tRNA(Ile)-lysidine synthase